VAFLLFTNSNLLFTKSWVALQYKCSIFAQQKINLL
jgi:hypothetical protein